MGVHPSSFTLTALPGVIESQARLNIFSISMNFSGFRHICEPLTCKIRKACRNAKKDPKRRSTMVQRFFTILLHFKGFPSKRDLYFYDFCAILYDFLENQPIYDIRFVSY